MIAVRRTISILTHVHSKAKFRSIIMATKRPLTTDSFDIEAPRVDEYAKFVLETKHSGFRRN